MKSARGEITINGFYDDVRSPTLLERKALDALPYDPAGIREELDVARLDTPRDRPIADRLAVWPTQTINGLHGGYACEGTKTVLPCEAMAKCDMRLVVGQTRDDALAKVEAHVRKHVPNAEFVPLGGMDPSKTPLDSPFADPVRRGMVEAQGEDPLIVPTLGSGLLDYVFTKILGIPAFGAPYANRDEANHAPNENLDVERFFAGIRTGVVILSQLGAMANPHGA
jgi:acetylornithine deacetylase/succinyl-diaminopimelate desuccinylase-like protein